MGLTAAGSSMERDRLVSRSGWSAGGRWGRAWLRGVRGAECKVRRKTCLQTCHQCRGNGAASLSSLAGRGSYADNISAERQGFRKIRLLQGARQGAEESPIMALLNEAGDGLLRKALKERTSVFDSGIDKAPFDKGGGGIGQLKRIERTNEGGIGVGAGYQTHCTVRHP